MTQKGEGYEAPKRTISTQVEWGHYSVCAPSYIVEPHPNISTFLEMHKIT